MDLRKHTQNIQVGTNSKTGSCIPFVSQYSDCTEENLCSGCNNCLCVAKGEWSCQPVKKCPSDEDLNFIDESSLDEAMYNIESEMAQQKKIEQSKSKSPLVPGPPKKGDDLLLDFDESYREVDIDREIVNIIGRRKRSIDTNANETRQGIKFHHTIDEINEDTLKNNNTSGTLNAKKVLNLSNVSRRTGLLNSDNTPSNESLHIEFSEPKAFDSHITDNKIDTTVHGKYNLDNVQKEKIAAIFGNQTQKQKDKDLSKLIVNELNKGNELIGDSTAPIMSNITFTPENDTLTAMAFIAGNLLNQLWNMEKDSSEESKEIENLKHEKIFDLLELFKEPLNLRQENFLKSALEHLSEAIDKNKILKNVSSCDKIEETKSILRTQNDSSAKNDSSEQKNETKCLQKKNKHLKTKDPTKKNQATSEAISKINNVLNLISKFQDVQKTLNGLKQSSDVNSEDKEVEASERKSKKSKVLTNDESDSLNVFGNILEKITKLIVPSKKGKKFVKSIRNHNILRKSDDVVQKWNNAYGIEVKKSQFTAKDKILLDYMNTVKRNPHCLLDNLKELSPPLSDVEGDTLLNIAQFLKIKSFVDLLKILESEKKSYRTDAMTTQQPERTSHIIHSTSTGSSSNLSNTKAKLKQHLKSIIEDLNELQLAKGIPARNFSIADTLPCIYNILNADQNVQNKVLTSPLPPAEKITEIFNSLKKELIWPQSRRSSVLIEPRPKSAIVWERIIKNFDGKDKPKSRRFMESRVPKSFDDLKKMIDEIESSSKTYKNKVILKGVSPSKRLVLLKALHEEAKKYVDVLEDINSSLENLEDLSVDKQNDIKDFIYNTNINLHLNSKVAKSLNKSNAINVKDDVEILKIKRQGNEMQIPKSLRMLDVTPSTVSKKRKLSRDDIINQLIKNRMQSYIRAKDVKGLDNYKDINYAIAKKILIYLEIGNYNLARELYKYIVHQKKFEDDISNDRTVVSSSAKPKSKSSQSFKEPLIQFEEPKSQNQMGWTSHDLWLRQLMNLKKI